MKKLFLLISIVTLSMAVNAGLSVPVPSTDFSGGYSFIAENAMLDGDIEFNNLSGSDYLRYYDRSPNGTASWFVTVTKPCLVSVTLNMFDNSWNYDGNDDARKIYKNGGHIFKVRIIDESETPKDSVFEASESSSIGDIALSGTLYFEEAGTYLIELLNSRAWSKCGISGITLTAESVPETSFASAYSCTASTAELNGNILYETGGPNDPYIRYNHSWKPGTAEWTILTTRACYLSATVNMADNTWNYDGNDNNRKYFQNHKHVFIVELLDAYNNLVDSVQEGEHLGNGGSDGWDTYPTVNLQGSIYIPKAGIYTIKLKNNRNESRCGVANVTLTYMGGAVQNISTSTNTQLDVADAWYSGCTRDNDKTYIQYPSSGTSSAWIKWNIATSATKMYDLKVNINTAHAHGFTAAIYEDGNATPVATATEGSYVDTKGILTIDLDRINLAGDKNYVVEVTNAPSGSEAKVLNVLFVPVNTTTVDIPGTLEPADAILSERAWVDNDSILFTARGDEGHNSSEWAKWKIAVAANAVYAFTLNAYTQQPAKAQQYTITVLSEDESETIATAQSKWTKTENALTAVLSPVELAAGSYIVKVQNTEWGSRGRVLNIVAEELTVITLDEDATDNSVIAANRRNGEKVVRLLRTITAGMYNTICLPFDISNEKLKIAFGSNVELRQMASATLDGTVLDLNFENVSTGIYRCVPYLIKTSHDVVNPVFTVSEIKEHTAEATGGTNADFIGTFIATELEADPNNLFLAANNKIYFPQNNAMPIKGMRAYFHVHNAPVGAIQRARIIEQGNVVTEVDLVNGELQFTDKQVHKTIEDGQLLIIRDGIRYNALGNKIK